jgi:thioredoxin reductase (NADPH)
VVGGANSAGQAAVHFARFAKQVSLLVRGSSLAEGMSKYLIDQIEATPNITVRTGCSVSEVHGVRRLEAITLCHTAGVQSEKLNADALLIFIGAMPRTEWIANLVTRDPHGFILTGADVAASGNPQWSWPLDRAPYYLESSTPGVFVAGDVRHGATRRVASGVGEGAIAVQLIQEYLRNV